MWDLAMMEWTVGMAAAPTLGVCGFAWIAWSYYVLRVETGKADWNKTLRRLLRFSVFMATLSNDVDLKAEIALLPDDIFEKARRDPTAITEVLKSLTLDPRGTTPLGTLRAMDRRLIPRNPNDIVIRWGALTLCYAFRFRLLQPVSRFVTSLRFLDTGPEGQWRGFGWLINVFGVLGSGLGYAFDIPLVYGFGALTAAGFMLHTVGFYRAGDRLTMLSRGVAVVATIAWMATGLLADKAYIPASLVFLAGAGGVLAYLVDPSRSRRYAGTAGSSLVMAGAICFVAGLPTQIAGICICVGVACNHSASLRQHLLELKYNR